MHAAGTGAERSDSAMQVAMRPLPNENEIKMAFVWILSYLLSFWISDLNIAWDCL